MLNPAAGVTVIWSVVAGGGSVDPATSLTDDDGTAETTATLGTALGTQEVIATAPGFPESPVSFLATTIAGPPHDIVKIDGDGQSGVPGSVLAVPLSVRVADQYDNPVEGQFVSWSVVQGGGTLSQSKTRTNSKGETSTTYSLGLVGGVNTIAAAANSAGAVSFTETGSAP
jgi:adhesin/invasin